MGKLAPYGSLIHEMWQAGATDPEIADRLAELGVDVTPDGIKLHRWVRGMPNPRRGKRPVCPIVVERLRKARSQGLTHRLLAERFGLSRPTVGKYLK